MVRSRLAAAAALFLFSASTASVCAERSAPRETRSNPLLPLSIVPAPKNVSTGDGAFEWPATIRVATVSRDDRAAASIFEDAARAAGSHTLVFSSDPAHADLAFATARPADPELGSEGYALTVKPTGVSVRANQPAGFVYAMQSLVQITAADRSGRLRTPVVSVRDWPSYRWRGIHLDVSRHFFAVATVKRYIDVAARYKLNVFHWHLTDDEAWRIEIKSHPLLTGAASCKADRTDCGFYTQADIRDVVAFARDRNVAVVPEIDVPGHSGAALRAYPALACDGTPGATVFCPTEQTFKFLEDVLGEVVALFPEPFVHIGGDEVSPRGWRSSAFVHGLMRQKGFTTYAQLQAYVMTRLSRYLEHRGRRAVAWDDALAGPIPKNVVIMAWRGQRAVSLGLERGHDVIASPDGPLYFDGYQGDPAEEAPAMRFRATLEQVYRYDPRPSGVAPAQRDRIIGVQANVWTEQISTPGHLFYMLLPRELALAEIAWAPRSEETWPGFRQRLPAQLAWLSEHGYGFRIPDVALTFSGTPMRFAPLGDSVQSGRAITGAPLVHLTLDAPVGSEIRFTTDGAQPTQRSRQYRSPLTIPLGVGETLELQAAAFVGGTRGPISRCTVRRTKTLRAAGPPGSYASWSAMISGQRAGIYSPPTFP